MKSHDWYDVTTIIILGVTLAAVITYTGLTAYQAWIARDTAHRQLRGYVYLDVSAWQYPRPPDVPNRYAVSLNLINGGETWAKNLRIIHAEIINPETPDPFNSKQIAWDHVAVNPIVLGPHQRFDLQYPDVPLSDLPSIKKGERNVFFVAWITYDDIFGAAHQTQLSRRLNADLEGIGHVSFSWMPTHNCADDDCLSER